MKMTSVEQRLREKGLRATPQRVALLSLLEAAQKPIGVEELVKKGKSAFDTATAYRVLNAFTAQGLARRIELSHGRAYFENAQGHHHHAVCRTCGKIADVEACLPRGLDDRVTQAVGFARIEDHALEFFGICAPCGKKV